MQKQERSNGSTLPSDIVIHDSEASVNSETDNMDKDNTENLYALPTLLANYRARLLIYAGLIGVVSIFFAVFSDITDLLSCYWEAFTCAPRHPGLKLISAPGRS